MSYTAKRFQDTLQACLHHKEAPTKTPAVKVKDTTGNNISFLAAEPSLNDMIVENDDDDNNNNNVKEIACKNKAEQLRKEYKIANKRGKNKQKAEGQRLRDAKVKRKQLEGTRRISDLTETEAAAQEAAADSTKAASKKEKTKKTRNEKQK